MLVPSLLLEMCVGLGSVSASRQQGERLHWSEIVREAWRLDVKIAELKRRPLEIMGLGVTDDDDLAYETARETSRANRTNRWMRRIYQYRLFKPHDATDFDIDWEIPQHIWRKEDYRHQLMGFLAPKDQGAQARG